MAIFLFYDMIFDFTFLLCFLKKKFFFFDFYSTVSYSSLGGKNLVLR